MSFLGKILFSLLSVCLLAVHTPALAAPAPLTEPPAQQQPQMQPQLDVPQMQRILVPDKQTMVPPVLMQGKLLLLPYLEYLIDPSFSADISEIAGPAYADKFQLFVPERLPLMGLQGVTWMRFVLHPVQDVADPLLLDMGYSTPGDPILYTASFASGELEWKEIHAQGNLLQVPPATSVPVVCYLRMDGVPGWWFAPTLHTMEDAVAASSSLLHFHEASLVALAVIFVLCLLKGLVEPGQWRLWAVLYLAAATLQTWSGLSFLIEGYTPKVIASLTTGGLALMLWPHVARHFLHSRTVSRFLDSQLILLCLPGAVATLLPLIPNFQWLARYTPLWPAAMVIFLPSALWACVCGAPSCLRFLVATTIPPLATAASILGLRSGFDPNLLSSLPSLGVAFGALVLLALGQKTSQPAAQAQAQAAAQAAPAQSLSLDLESSSLSMAPDMPAAQDSLQDSLQAEPEVVLLEEAAEDQASNPWEKLVTSMRTLRESLPEFASQLNLSPQVRSGMDQLAFLLKETETAVNASYEEVRRTEENVRRFSVLAISTDSAFCAVLNHVLRRVNCQASKAATLEDALETARQMYPKIVIFEGSFAAAASARALQDMKHFLAGYNIAPMFLAYTPDDSTWKELGAAGFTHALVLPIDDEALINTIREFRKEQEEAGIVPSIPAAVPPASQQHGVGAADQSGAEESAGRDDVFAGESNEQAEEHDIPDLFGTGPVSSSSHSSSSRPASSAARTATMPEAAPAAAQPAEAGKEPVRESMPFYEIAACLNRAKNSLSRGDFDALVRQMTPVTNSDDTAVARMAELVIKAAKSRDAGATADLLQQLSASVFRRSR